MSKLIKLRKLVQTWNIFGKVAQHLTDLLTTVLTQIATNWWEMSNFGKSLSCKISLLSLDSHRFGLVFIYIYIYAYTLAIYICTYTNTSIPHRPVSLLMCMYMIHITPPCDYWIRKMYCFWRLRNSVITEFSNHGFHFGYLHTSLWPDVYIWLHIATHRHIQAALKLYISHVQPTVQATYGPF